MLALAKANKPEPQYIIDDIAKEKGYIILRLLPYHPDLNHYSNLQEWYDALFITITLFTVMFLQNHF
jgi:hypothetical protein